VAPAPLATSVRAADPESSLQLVKGFYDAEQDAWRWTMKEFAIALGPPVGGSDAGATLRMQFTVPEPVIQQLGAVTLSAQVGEAALDPETYDEPGAYMYERTVPPEVLIGDVVAVEFTLDKAIAPGEMDLRELGIIFSAAGLETR